MERINQWTTVIANFGVIAGILVLAYQVNENTHQMKADSLLLNLLNCSQIGTDN